MDKKEKPKVIRSLRKALMDKVKGKQPMSLCTYAFKTMDNEVTYRINDICFASARVANGMKEFVIDIARTRQDLAKEEFCTFREWYKYAKYIFYDSPWAPYFKSKSLANALRYGLAMNTDKPFSRIISAAIALREGMEYPQKVRLFNRLMSDGISGDAAYVVTMAYQPRTHKNLNEIRAVFFGSGHNTISHSADADQVFKFFGTKEFNPAHSRPAKKSAHSFEVFLAATPNVYYPRNRIEDFLRKDVKFHKVGDGWNITKVTKYSEVLVLAQRVQQKIQLAKVQHEG